MNFILGRMIQVLKTDEETFWAFTMLLEKILPFDYYIQMMGVSADVKYFGEEILARYIPEVHEKFKELNFNPSFFSFNWFTCLFQDKLSDAVRTFLTSHTYSFPTPYWTFFSLKAVISFLE